ncbi:MAG TPA: hypothetical protein DCR24_01110 [Bacillus bacterium]|nr:hypothetical protein [Bacillus sp. (in: firmicutes)]
MTTFLLLLSLILNAAAIFAIILLYLRQNRLVEAEKKQGKIIGEIEEIFSAYLLELKEEHDQFIDKMRKTQRRKEAQASEEEPPEKHETEGRTVASPRVGTGITYHAARKAYKQNSDPINTLDGEPGSVIPSNTPPNQIDQDLIRFQQLSMIDQVIQLEKQGLSIENIARRLNKGKTEVELLLKFRQNTQE